MSLELTILGLLSWNPQSGYDLKKSFSAVEFIPWSGNNNQIYRTLLRLHSEGLVDSQITQPESGPAKKIYTLTEKGYTSLKAQLLGAPELEQVKNTFLIQLAFAEILETRLILQLLEDYCTQITERKVLLTEEFRRAEGYPGRSERETLIWTRITDRRLESLDNEKKWAESLMEELKETFHE
ncbi:MAG: helix-turn-helix transcriptional regulator [Spirochaetales bacterium]|nr:helix-turn-helix transcriptional regulator [Spirochaetales bacterium]